MIPERISDSRRAAPAAVTLDKLKRRKVEWLWKGRVPRGMLTILEGRKGTGKSTLAAALVADVTGGPRLERGKRRTAGNVCWLSAEEDYARVIRPRFEAAGAKLERVVLPHAEGRQDEPRRFTFPFDLDVLEDIIRTHKIRLAVLDPLSSFVDPQLSLNDEQQVRAVLEGLKRVAERTGCALILIRHLRKSGQGPALDQGLGSTGIGNVARSILRVDPYPRDKDRRCLSHVACNLGAAAPTLVFRLNEFKGAVRLKWEGESSLDAEKLAEGQGDAAERDARADARMFLRRELDSGDRKVKELEKLADESGIGRNTLRRAKEELGVTSHPIGPNEARYMIWRKPKRWPPERDFA